MADNNESTMKWKLDISDLKSGMQEVKRSISLANAEFKNATADMGKWGDSASGVSAKIEQLTKTADAQEKILANLKQQYQIVAENMGEASPQAERLKIQIENQEAAVKRTNAQIQDYSGKLDAMNAEQAASESAYGQLNSKIEDQSSELAQLKDAYARAVVEYGKNSTQAKELAGNIQDLSSELSENKSKIADADAAADRLDKSLDDAGKSADDAASGGFTVLKGALADLASNVIQDVISSISDLMGEAIDSADGLQKFASTMSFAGYDDATIKQATEDVKDYADKTVYDLNDVSNTTAQLAANGIQDYTGLTEAAGNLNAVAGGNSDTFKSVAMVLTQTAGAGKLTTENWNQLANAIPGASGVLQDAMLKNGAYTGDFREAMANGEITADEFNQAIMDLGYTDAAQEAATSTTTFEGAMGNLQATVVSALMDIYNTIGAENITGFINGISGFVQSIVPSIKNAVQWFIDNLPIIAPLLAGIAGGLAALLIAQQIQAMVTAFNAWKTATEGLTIAQRLLNIAQLSSPIGLIVAGIAAAVAAIVVLWNTNEDFRNAVISAWDAIKATVSGVIDALVNFFTVTLPGAFSGAINAVVSWATSFVQSAIDAGANFVSSVANALANLPYNIGFALGTVIGTVANWAITFAQNAQQAGSQFVQNVISFVQNLPANVAAFLNNVIFDVVSWAGSMAGNAQQAGTSFLNNVVNMIRSLPGKVAGFLNDVIGKVARWASDMGAKGAQAASQLFNSVVNGIAGLPGRVASIGGDIVHGLWNGISGAIGWFQDKVSGFASGILHGMKAALGINSPSTLFRDEVGKWIPAGIAEGFGAALPSAIGDMRRELSASVGEMAAGINLAAGTVAGVAGGSGAVVAGDTVAGNPTVVFNQYNSSPETLDRLSIYRDTDSLLFSARARGFAI